MDALWQDLRYAVRAVRKSPGFVGVAAVTLALGIGATTVVFSAIDGILIHPFPYKDSDRLVSFYIHDPKRPRENGRNAFSMPEFMDFREQNRVFDDMMGTGFTDILYTHQGETEQFAGSFVTPNMFDFLGVPPLLGRRITEAEAAPGGPPVFVMSYRLWTQHFHGDPKLLGTTLTLNGVPRTLVTIMPPRFLPANSDIWLPIAFSHTEVTEGGFPLFFGTRGRLKRGMTLRAAADDLGAIAARLSAVYPRDYPKPFTVLTATFADNVVGDFKGMLYALMAAVALLLLIGCSNVAHLLLARATAREKEIAIRAALGAGRARLVRQLLLEALLVSLIGGVLGCGFAYAGLKGVVAAIPPNRISPTAAIEFNPRVLFFAAGVSLLTTMLCGWVPALHVLRGELHTRLTAVGRGAGSSIRHGKLRAALVITEVALSILLLAGAGLMMRTLFALQHVDLGFNPTHVFSARLPLPKGRYETAEQKRLLFRRILDRITALPGVVAATQVFALPPYGGIRSDIEIPGKTHGEQWQAQFQLCSEGYLTTIGVPVLRGRDLSATDIESAHLVAVINERLARNFFGDEDPIGRAIKFNFLDRVADAPHNAAFEVIGVVKDFKNQGLQEPTSPEAYLPHTITGAFNRGVLARTTVDPRSILSSVRHELFAVDPNIAFAPPTGSLEDFLQQISYAGPEFGVITLTVFAGVGLLLVTVGVFGVMAYSVSVQTHDIGVRRALGAEREHILRMVMNQALVLIGSGIALGLAACWAGTRLIASQIWGVSPTDPFTFAAVTLIVLTIGLAASFVPARTATMVDPLLALRAE